MKIVPFGEVCTLEYGKPLDKEFRKSDGDFLAYGANGPISSASKYLIEGPSIIVGRKGSAGEITLVESNVWPLDVTYYIKHNLNETDLRYLFYALKSLNIKQFVRGVKPGLNRNDVYELPIPLPSLEAQREIVEKLDSAFAEIDLLEEKLELIDKNVDQLLNSMLKESLAKSEVHLAQGESLRNEKFISSRPLGEGTIDELCNVEYGTRVVRKKDAGTIYPVYGGGGETFFLDSFNRENRVVVARFAMSEKCTRRVIGKFALNDSGLTLSTKNQKLLQQDFLDYYVLGLNDQIYDCARGTAQKNLDVPAFRQMIVTYPESLDTQREIVEKLDLAFAEIETIRNQIAIKKDFAGMLRQSLLNNFFSTNAEKRSA